jgi:hypothetical protein
MKIVHPKEREIGFYKLHDVVLCNEKLFHMKLLASSECLVCKETQTTNHIFHDCVNAQLATKALNDCAYLFEHDPHLRDNTISLVQRLLFLNRNKKVNVEVFIQAINNRIEDLNVVANHKKNAKNLIAINKLTLTC